MIRVMDFVRRHPQLASGIALAIGMVIILWLTAPREVLKPTQMATLVAATVGLAALCTWIIGWEK